MRPSDGEQRGHPVDGDRGAGGDPAAAVPPREPAKQRLQRNWNEILQELRVTQTGSQIITGFLLTLPFQQRFRELDAFQVKVYLVLVVIASLTTALALTPVSLHRTLFRRGAKGQLVGAGNLIVEIVLLGVALVLSGTVLLIFDVVVGRSAALVAGGVAVALMTGAALGFPLLSRRLRVEDEPEDASTDAGRAQSAGGGRHEPAHQDGRDERTDRRPAG